MTIREECEKICLDFLNAHPALKDKVIVTIEDNPLFCTLSFEFSTETCNEDENGDSEVQWHRVSIDY